MREYKYVKAKDDIVPTAQTQKEQKDCYANLVANISLRTLHEIWESDRDGHVDTISLMGYVTHINDATGNEERTPLIAVATRRKDFEALNLARIEPAATLRHLHAEVSKNPFGRVPIATSAVSGPVRRADFECPGSPRDGVQVRGTTRLAARARGVDATGRLGTRPGVAADAAGLGLLGAGARRH